MLPLLAVKGNAVCFVEKVLIWAIAGSHPDVITNPVNGLPFPSRSCVCNLLAEATREK